MASSFHLNMRTTTAETRAPKLRPSTNISAARSLSTTRRIRDIVTTQNSSLIIDRKERFHIKDESAWATKDEEKNEISTQLTFLRKRHDISKDVLSQRERLLESLQHEYNHLSMMEDCSRKGQTNLQEHVDTLEEELLRIRRLQDTAKDERYVYEHLLERMKVTKLHLELKATAFMESLKNKKGVLSEQLQRMRKSQEHSFLTKQALHVVKDLFQRETKDKEGQVLELEKNAKSRREMATRRDDRQRRQVEIAEAAANEERDSEEVRLREGYLLHKFWCKALTRKLQKDKAESVEIEEAFQRIRGATGLSDVREIVERFLTREQTYTDLVQAVSDGEKKSIRLKAMIAERKEQIKAFEVSEKQLGALHPSKNLEADIARETKEVQAAQEKLQKHTILYEHIAEWGDKMLKRLRKFAESEEEESADGEKQEGSKLKHLFEKLRNVYGKIVEPLKAQRDKVLKEIDLHASMKIDEIFEHSPRGAKTNVRVRRDSSESESDRPFIDPEVESELQEQRRKIKQHSYERQESAKRKRAKEKKPEPKKPPQQPPPQQPPPQAAQTPSES